VLSRGSSAKWRSANAGIPSHMASSEVETNITRRFSTGCSAMARASAISAATAVALSFAPGIVPREPMSAKAAVDPTESTVPSQVSQRL
jgi:hypothetical protein